MKFSFGIKIFIPSFCYIFNIYNTINKFSIYITFSMYIKDYWNTLSKRHILSNRNVRLTQNAPKQSTRREIHGRFEAQQRIKHESPSKSMRDSCATCIWCMLHRASNRTLVVQPRPVLCITVVGITLHRK